VLITALLLLLFRFSNPPDATARLDHFPERGAAFASRVLEPEPAEQTVIGAARLMKRLCQTATQQVVLSVIDSTLNRHAAHDPSYCLRGAGWTVVTKETLAVPGGEAVKLSLQRGKESIQAVYWFSDGTHRHGSPARHWLTSALLRLTPGSAPPAPVLVLLFPATGTADWPLLWKEIPELWAL
jgi:hypothetical protein